MTITFNPFTPARREKFKCTIFCFRSYVEDAAFFIAIIGIFLSTALFLICYREMAEHDAANYSTYRDRRQDSLRLFGISSFSILLHVGIIVALVTRIPGFFAPYLIVSAIGFLIPGYAFAYSAFYAATSIMDSRFSSFLERNTTYKSTVDWSRFEALNGFVLIGVFLLLQIWVFSIVWRAMSAVKFEKIAQQLAKDQQANRGGTFVQPSGPMMIDVLKPTRMANNNGGGGNYSIA